MKEGIARFEIQKACLVPNLTVYEGEIYYVSSGTSISTRDLRVDGLLFVDGEVHIFGNLMGTGELKGVGEVLMEV